MNEEFLKELNALADRYGLEVLTECAYCGRNKSEAAVAYCDEDRMVTFVQKLVEAKKP
jgi:hypothetical protein